MIDLDPEARKLLDEYQDCFEEAEWHGVYREMVRRNFGKIKVLALDLEYTLITSADKYGRTPRMDLTFFLEACRELFPRIVIFTAVAEDLFREAAREIVARGEAPDWFPDMEYVDWPRQGYKDLSYIPGIKPLEALIVDDYRPYIHPNQLFQWVEIRGFASHRYYQDRELIKTLGVLEMIQTHKVRKDLVVDYLRWYVDYDQRIKCLRIYGPVAMGEGDWKSTLKIALEIDPIAQERHVNPVGQSIMDRLYLDLYYFFWVNVELAPFTDDDQAVEIQSPWEFFYAIVTRTPGRLDIIFPDLPGCQGVYHKTEDDKYFEDTDLSVLRPARHVLEAWLQQATPEALPDRKLTRKELKERYPGALIVDIGGQVPWRKK